jgi:hypothetical protein
VIIPALTFDFTSAVLDPRIGFTRALATATRYNASGFIEGVAADTPRFDYDPATLASKGLLIEEARSNICLSSGNIANIANWNGDTSGGSVPIATANYALAPDNTMTATRLQINRGAGTFSRWRQGIASSSNVYVDSVWMRTTSGSGTANVGLRNASVGVNCVVTGQWKRFSVSSSSATTSPDIQILSFTSIAGTDVSADVLVWGAQVEAGAFPTSYIPTTTTALTRNADVAAITGTNFSDFWQASKGGASVLATPSTVSGIRPLVQFDDNTANEIIALRGNTTNPELYIVDGGAPQAQIDAGTIVANTPYSLTGWWDTNDCKARKDSGAVVTDNTATIPTVTQARIGSDGTNYLNGTIATINYYDSFFGQPIYTRRKNKVFSSLL